MKVHYINILLFALPLNILFLSSQAHNKNKPSITPHTPKIPSTRLLCECDLYMPNYDNDPQMKEVMDNFNRQTQQRFHEYDEKMQSKRIQCKEQCDKEIQKIILKDKLEKELMDKFATLQTDIQNDAIPTCVCEKSLADKTEKFCLNCGVQLGGGVLQASGLLGGIGQLGLDAWKAAALVTAKELAEKAGVAAGLKAGDAAGMKVVIRFLKQWGIEDYCREIFNSFVSTNRYAEVANISGAIIKRHGEICAITPSGGNPMCLPFDISFGIKDAAGKALAPPPVDGFISKMIKGLAGKAEQAAATASKNASETVTAAIKARETALIEGRFESSITSINASIIAIIVIVLIMVIIYLILRYRRKKKMKKKLQYIKLLKE